MATRATISRLLSDGTAEGVYHHWDGYPDGLGSKLWELFNDFFQKSIDDMLLVLIDGHPAGWSSIQKNWRNGSAGYGSEGPECYCHGERSEEANPLKFIVTPDYLNNIPNRDSREEFNYVINPQTLEVRVYNGSGRFLSSFYLNTEEPDWGEFGEEEES